MAMEGLRKVTRWTSYVGSNFDIVALMFLILEFVATVLIIKLVPYTEIDWVAYMQEVEGVINGTFDYTFLKGDTGPLVYPAGFVYIFTLLYYVTNNGANILAAQWIFGGIYLLNLTVVLGIYRRISKSSSFPPFIVFFLGCTAYRVHSIYVLRLFNDPVAMLFLYFAVWLFMSEKWTIGSIMYSLAVSIKMNVLLFSPGLLVVYLLSLGWQGTLFQLAVCAVVQGVLGAPFIISNPVAYITGAFNFGRVFLFEWTVNWRMLPEWVFLSKTFHVVLLLLHLVVLLLFALKHWTRSWRGVRKHTLSQPEMAWILFTANFIGITFSRSLHYQFYVWYFHSLPFLLWSTGLHSLFRIALVLLLEVAWNVYPSTVFSSILLHTVHCIMLVSLYTRPVTRLVSRKEC